MERKELLEQHLEIRNFIAKTKKKLEMIDGKKIHACKKYVGKIEMEIEVPFDIATYESIMKTKINVRLQDLHSVHKDLPIKKSPITLSPKDVTGWLEILLRKVKKRYLVGSFYVNYRKHTREMRKDTKGIVEKNLKEVFQLQQTLVNDELEFILFLYRQLPSILKKVREEKAYAKKL